MSRHNRRALNVALAELNDRAQKLTATELGDELALLARDLYALPATLDVHAPRATAPIVVKTCGCGATYTAEQWALLAKRGYIGTTSTHAFDRRLVVVELRDCVCTRTLGMAVTL